MLSVGGRVRTRVINSHSIEVSWMLAEPLVDLKPEGERASWKACNNGTLIVAFSKL